MKILDDPLTETPTPPIDVSCTQKYQMNQKQLQCSQSLQKGELSATRPNNTHAAPSAQGATLSRVTSPANQEKTSLHSEFASLVGSRSAARGTPHSNSASSSDSAKSLPAGRTHKFRGTSSTQRLTNGSSCEKVPLYQKRRKFSSPTEATSHTNRINLTVQTPSPQSQASPSGQNAFSYRTNASPSDAFSPLPHLCIPSNSAASNSNLNFCDKFKRHFKLHTPSPSPLKLSHCNHLPFWYGLEDESQIRWLLQNEYSLLTDETKQSVNTMKRSLTHLGRKMLHFVGCVKRVVCDCCGDDAPCSANSSSNPWSKTFDERDGKLRPPQSRQPHNRHEKFTSKMPNSQLPSSFITFDQVFVYQLDIAQLGKTLPLFAIRYVETEYDPMDGTIKKQTPLTRDEYDSQVSLIDTSHRHVSYLYQRPPDSSTLQPTLDDFEFLVSSKFFAETHSVLLAEAIHRNFTCVQDEESLLLSQRTQEQELLEEMEQAEREEAQWDQMEDIQWSFEDVCEDDSRPECDSVGVDYSNLFAGQSLIFPGM